MMRRVLLVVNREARGGRAGANLPELLEALRQKDVRADGVITARPGHAVELARDAAPAYDCVAAVGGDGTVNEVASGLLLATGGRAVLGVVPNGTGNDVAQLLGIHSVAEAVDVLTQGSIRKLDVIEVACRQGDKAVTRYALLFAAAGFSGELLRHTTPRVKRWFGPRYCYSVGFLRALFTFRAPLLTVTCDGSESRGKRFLVCAGNSEYAGGGIMRLSPGARPDDGRLNVSVVEALGPIEAARYFPKLLTGDHIGHPKLRYFEATTLTLEADPPIGIQLDGDRFGRTPARFQVRPGRLRVLAAR